MSRKTLAAAALALSVAMLVATGCSKKSDSKTTTTPWPTVKAERSIPRPEGVARWPLLGIEAPSPTAAKSRVVSVKIENSPAARPQSNLDKADVVYETLTEGGISRFNALYHSQTPDTVGPVRSARLSDIYIVPQYNALFAHVGGNAVVMNMIKKEGLQDMDQFFNPTAYRRSRDRSAPHNMYLDISKLRQAAVERRKYPAEQTPAGLAFGGMGDNASTMTVSAVDVPFSPANRVGWTYDPASKLYSRSNNGKPHTDKVSGKAYQARNVVVMWTKTSQANRTSKGYSTLEIDLIGGGRVSVFRDGVRYDGQWSATKSSPPVLKAEDGRLIKLAPGITWFQVIPTDINITMR